MTQGTTPPFVSPQRHGAPAFAPDLEVQVVSTREGLSNLESEYSRLHEASRDVLPFALHEWHVAWWDHFAQASKRIRDSLRIHLVREHGNPIGLIPLVLTERAFARFTIGTMGLLGADPNVTELRNPLVVPGAEARRLATLSDRRLLGRATGHVPGGRPAAPADAVADRLRGVPPDPRESQPLARTVIARVPKRFWG